MAIALVLDFPGGTRAQYEETVERMQLGGHLETGGLHHAAGSHEGGWRVIDVWESLGHFERFRNEKIIPITQAVGLAAPSVRMFEVDDTMEGSSDPTALVQCVTLPGLDREAFRAAHDRIVPGGRPPEGLTWHVNGPVEGGWCVIDGWTSKEIRDRFIEDTIQPGMADAPLTGAPTFEDLVVEAEMGAGTTAAV